MKFRLTALTVALVMANIACAATEIDLRRQSVSYIENKLSMQTHNSIVKIEKMRTDTDFNGATHTRIRQFYNGIPVWDATGVIHTPRNNKIRKNMLVNIDVNTTMNGVIYENIEKDLIGTPAAALTSSAASKALEAAKNWHARKSRLTVDSFKNGKSLPIIFIDDNKQAHHAYLTSFTYATASAMHRPTSIVDAVTHHVYRSWEGIFTAHVQEEEAINTARAKVKKMLNNDDPAQPGLYDIAAGGIGGNPKSGEVIYDGGQGNKPALNMKAMDMEVEMIPGNPYKMTFCVLMNDDISVVDTATGSEVVIDICMPNSRLHKGIAWLSMNKNQTRWDADEMNEGYSPSLDAFYAAVMVKSLYQDWFGVPALIDEEGKPMKYLMRVHFGRKFDNAFWDGEQMTFGDGGSMFYPLTSVGVTAHEISHGFTETHSGIDGSKPQMAALHESFSDMAAIAVENYMTGKNGWDIGREIKKDEGALRYLDNPTKDGTSIDHMKNFDDTEAHGGAGVTNKAFYLLATTKGWNTRKAFDVMVKANMHYWTSSMNTFNDAACGVVSATKDYGYDVADVRIAFAKVGVDTDNCDAK
ncbi:Zinc metalloproteinase [Aquicella siphonis]|uniref:Neutral metalloproteinase n=1 Tax=Aquicella siphonis TaxID=254247 RepID=A0A5E4PFW8_9COXI|nr:M4 family metallopeptidase [Aquicella siphonis]VVC75422.1 Zinc metalloproteinase [Aquicella siphonis]